jgi:putative hydrolase of the HAD superfamily
MKRIRAVIWDFERVLLQSECGGFRYMLANRLGASLEDADRILRSPVTDRWDLGEISDDEFYLHILKELNLPAEMKAVLERCVMEDFFIDRVLLAYIRGVHAAFATALLTNFPAHIHDFMRTAWRVDGAFDHIVASCDVRLLKPAPRIFRLALERLGVSASEAVMVDDQLPNVAAARALGMAAVHFRSRAQAIADVETLLLAAS